MQRKSSLYSLLFTMFNDSLGWGVALTIFAPLLLNPESRFLPLEASLETRNLFLGILIAAYPLAQFVFLPFLGAVSDHLGRKRVLTWTTLGVALSFVLSALAIRGESLWLLLAGRVLGGIFSANSATAQAAIADMSSEKQKGKNLALAGIAGGLSWVVGPPLGGFLSTPRIFPWADFSTPFWTVALLFVCNYVWVLKSFEETHVVREKHDWKHEIKNLVRLSRIPHVTPWICVSFLFYFGWGCYILFFPALLVQRFAFTQAEIGLLSAYLSIFWLLTSMLLNRGIAERFKPEAFLLGGLPILGFLSIILSFTSSIVWWYVAFPLVAICGSSIWINGNALLSNLVGKENQGKVFGVLQSLSALAMCTTPILSGALAGIDDRIPLGLGGVVLLAAGILACLHAFYRSPKH